MPEEYLKYMDKVKFDLGNKFYIDSLTRNGQTHPKSSAFTYNLEEENLVELINIASEQISGFVSNSTIYVKDISYLKLEFKTLIFNIDGSIIKSKDYSKIIMNRFFELHHFTYQSIQHLGKLLDIHQKCPYVLGNSVQFAPEEGTAKKSTNWLALHHVNHTKKLGLSTVIKIGYHKELVLPIDYRMIQTMVDRTSLLVQTQIILFNDFNRYFNKSPHHYSNERNVVDIKLEEWSYLKNIPNFIELQEQFLHIKALEILNEIIKEHNPLREDFEKNSKFNKKI